MRGPEVVAGAGVDVGHVDVAAYAFDGEIGVGVDDGIMTYLDAFLRDVLHSEVVDDGRVVGRIVAGEIAHVGTQFHTQHLGYTERKIKVGVE